MTIRSFTTQNGEVVTGKVLEDALAAVAHDWAELGRKMRASDDCYADHVTEAEKDAALDKMLADAQRISEGGVDSLTIAQRLNEKLTGECIPLMPF